METMKKRQTSSLIVRMPFPVKAVVESAQSSSHKSRSTQWRERLRKENPEKYKELKKTDRQRKKVEHNKEVLDDSRRGRYKRKLKQEKKLAQQQQRRRKQKLAKQSETSSAASGLR